MPVERSGVTTAQLPMNLSSAERDRRLKEMTTEQLGGLEGTLYEQSQETWTYDKNGSWIISEEALKLDKRSGKVDMDVVLKRRMGVLLPASISRFLYPEAICREAFESHGDHLCCPRQIAAVLRLDFGEVVQELGEIEEALYQTSEMEERGCTPELGAGRSAAWCCTTSRSSRRSWGPRPSPSWCTRTTATSTPAPACAARS